MRIARNETLGPNKFELIRFLSFRTLDQMVGDPDPEVGPRLRRFFAIVEARLKRESEDECRA